MYEFSFIEFFLRAIPEGFLFIFAVYSFSRNKINKKNYLISSILMAILVISIRFLPINYGVHSILNIIVLIILSVVINKIDIIKAIQSAITIMILQFTCEGVNVFIIRYIFKLDMQYVFSDTNLKTLYGIPSILIFATIIIAYYKLVNRKELKNV